MTSFLCFPFWSRSLSEEGLPPWPSELWSSAESTNCVWVVGTTLTKYWTAPALLPVAGLAPAVAPAAAAVAKGEKGSGVVFCFRVILFFEFSSFRTSTLAPKRGKKARKLQKPLLPASGDAPFIAASIAAAAPAPLGAGPGAELASEE